jgi:hypothetical protein
MEFRRKFTREFKLTAVRRLEAGQSVGEVARALAHVCAFLRPSVCNPLKTQGRFSVFEKV